MMEWVTCPSCGHKLFKVDGGSACFIEVKCHSCKQIVAVNIDRSSTITRIRKREGRKQ